MRSRKIVTRYGQMGIEQSYRYCDPCKKHSYFESLSEKSSYGRLSSKMTEIVCFEGKDMPFRQASDKISRNFNISISHDTIRRATETIGLQEFNKQKQELKGEEVLECEELPISEQIYLQIDGSMINTTTEGWTENQTPIRELYSYFDARRDKIRYDIFIKDGHPIGSGAIESAHKYTVQTRLKQAGMRWNIENANGVVQLRSTYLSGD